MPSGATGILRMIKGNTGQIREVQKNAQNLNIGDKVVTSGFSDIYPAGFPNLGFGRRSLRGQG
ncbi:hypothetical protein Ct9H90mP29_17000 [bacterium]|nr:MAG: hypothetical protein Ct9H90mP29_17000 [bacterium]